jgi:hypothetical protein
MVGAFVEVQLSCGITTEGIVEQYDQDSGRVVVKTPDGITLQAYDTQVIILERSENPFEN